MDKFSIKTRPNYENLFRLMEIVGCHLHFPSGSDIPLLAVPPDCWVVTLALCLDVGQEKQKEQEQGWGHRPSCSSHVTGCQVLCSLLQVTVLGWLGWRDPVKREEQE